MVFQVRETATAAETADAHKVCADVCKDESPSFVAIESEHTAKDGWLGCAENCDESTGHVGRR